MREHLSTIAVPGLRFSLGLVVLLQSIHFALSPSAAHHFAQTGLPQWVKLTLAWSEAAAAILFLLPITTLVGGSALVLIFAIAVALHFQFGDFQIGGLIVYAMAVLVCVSYR